MLQQHARDGLLLGLHPEDALRYSPGDLAMLWERVRRDRHHTARMVAYLMSFLEVGVARGIARAFKDKHAPPLPPLDDRVLKAVPGYEEEFE